MCGRYALTAPADVLARLFQVASDAVALPSDAPAARYNIAPTQCAPIVRLSRREGGRRRLEMQRWGLVPAWADDPSIGGRMINARCESAGSKPAFRDALRRRRCLVPADGFFEWKGDGSGKQPWFIHAAAGGPLAFAGLWERWRAGDDDPWLLTFTILTTEANRAVSSLHDRMPVMVPPEHFDLWLDGDTTDPEALAQVLRPAPDDSVAMHPVSRRVNTPANDDPALLEPVEETPREDRQGRLF